MPRTRYGLALDTWNGQLLAIGGSGGGTILDVYDLSANTWTTSSFQLGMGVSHGGVLVFPPADAS